MTCKKKLNKFRLGNRRLQIETGRHTVPKTPENLLTIWFTNHAQLDDNEQCR